MQSGSIAFLTTTVWNFLMFRDSPPWEIREALSLFLVGIGIGQKVYLGWCEELLQEDVHGFHQFQLKKGIQVFQESHFRRYVLWLLYLLLPFWELYVWTESTKYLLYFRHTDDIDYIWTGGRKCNFKGCERKDLQPAIINGWFWASTNMRIPNKRRCRYCDWSRTGG